MRLKVFGLVAAVLALCILPAVAKAPVQVQASALAQFGNGNFASVNVSAGLAGAKATVVYNDTKGVNGGYYNAVAVSVVDDDGVTAHLHGGGTAANTVCCLWQPLAMYPASTIDLTVTKSTISLLVKSKDGKTIIDSGGPRPILVGSVSL